MSQGLGQAVSLGSIGLIPPTRLIREPIEELYVMELSNETLTNIEGRQVANPDLSLTINRSDLEQVMMGVKTLMAMIQDGTAKVVGDPTILARIGSAMVTFDSRFPIMPGTQLRPSEIPEVDPYATEFGKPIPESRGEIQGVRTL